jgi:sarcosine oxidase subunit beta
MPGITSDVLIVGGGVIGASVAYYLTRRGVSVALLEKSDLASGSSGACDGLVFLQSKKPGIHLRLALESKRLFERLAVDLPIPIEYRNCGGMVVIETEKELGIMDLYTQQQREIGLDVALLDAAAARKLEPALSESIKGAAYSPMDGKVNPMALTHGFALGAKQTGAKIRTHTRVIGFHRKGNRILGVDTDQGRFSSEVVVIAAGVYTPAFGEMLGLSIPIRPRRGQILVTEPAPTLISRCLLSASYIAAKYDPELAKTGGEGISLEQTDGGSLLLGSTREFVGFDRRTTPAGVGSIAKKTATMIPALAKMNVIRSYAGLRPWTPDGLPILGPVEGFTGLIVAAGHEGDGIALSPITGELIAQTIVDGRTELSMEPFRLERFAEMRGES